MDVERIKNLLTTGTGLREIAPPTGARLRNGPSHRPRGQEHRRSDPKNLSGGFMSERGFKGLRNQPDSLPEVVGFGKPTGQPPKPEQDPTVAPHSSGTRSKPPAT